MNNKIKFQIFKEEIEKVKDKTSYVESHIYRTYCPVAEKKAILDIMCNKAKSKTEHDIKYMDQLLLKLNFDLAIIILYTDIDLKDAELNSMEIYDYFKENKIINIIYGVIGEEEITELMAVQQYIIDAFYDIENSTQEIIRSNLDRYTTVLKSFLDSFKPELLEKLKEQETENEKQNK